MGNRTFTEICDQNFENEKIEVNKITYYKNEKLLNVDMTFYEIFFLGKLEAFVKDIKKESSNIQDVKLSYIYDHDYSVDGLVEDYFENIKYILEKKSRALSVWIKESEYKLEGDKLTIILNDYMASNTLMYKEFDIYLQKYFKDKFNISLKVAFDCNVEESKKYDVLIEEKKINDIKEHQDEVEKAMKEAAKNPKPKGESNVQTGGFQAGGSGGSATFKRKAKDKGPEVVYRNSIKREIVTINSANEEEGMYAFEAKVFEKELRDLKSGKGLLSLAMSDGTNSISCKLFLKEEEKAEIADKIEMGKWYKVEGVLRYDTFEREMALYINSINYGKKEKIIMDEAKEKRVELHLHSNMSDMDGLTPISKLIDRAKKWGHKAIAVTDHGVLQAFPEAMESSEGDDIKVIYGVEGYLINDSAEIVLHADERKLDSEFIIFDIETTGLSHVNDKITEIGAIKVKNYQIVETYSQLVNPEMPIPAKIVELTGITDDLLKNEPTIDYVLPKFLEFCGDSPVVAHNAKFDTAFIKTNAIKQGFEYSPIVLDTLSLSRLLLKDIKRHRLNTIAKHLKVTLENHHRAVDDATATAKIFLKFLDMLKEEEVNTLKEINKYALSEMNYKMLDSYHIIILVKNQVGLKNLYKLVSSANLNTFYKRPLIPKSLLSEMREGLIIGSACEAGELYRAITQNKSDEEIDKIVEFYDYVEIQPIGNNQFMIEKGLAKDEEELENINKRILALGDKHGKLTVATGDVHFMDAKDEIFRRILMAGKGFSDADNQPPLYFRTTNDMLGEFKYLGDRAYEVVVENTNKIADMIDSILPVPSETCPPIIEGSEEELREMCNAKARRIYGDVLPEIVQKRLDRELNSIISNGYAVMYIIAQKLVTKSLEDGYLVGSRGSVGSSFAATMSDITEVNPLPPHYVCENVECKYSEFSSDGSLTSGADLVDKDCPKCGERLKKDGHDIPFEVFLGFEGDKEPDIDLNFAGVYQATSHKYTEELFGTGYVFKAGTIGTIADKTAYGFVKKYYEERDIRVNSKETIRLASGCTGVKRTSGQHPGGIMVVPNYKEIYDFCPIQYPANDASSGVITTHFDYHSISGRLLKLDILGHDVPTIIKQLEGDTGINVDDIALDNPETLKIFTSTKTLGIIDDSYNCPVGSLGIPEFGTKFVRQMLIDTQPTTFGELVRISGLSHGTDVWINNAQELVRAGTAELKDVISTRDDIMNYLIYKGLPPKSAFTIMERVRKGKGLTDENIEMMKENAVPDWYIWSCNTIKYMFPKAHAVAYVMMSFRIAYFKVHHPLAFYASFFTIKVDDFDAELVCKGKDAVRAKIKELESSNEKLSKKEQDLYTLLEVCNEMYSRGLDFNKVDLYRSNAEVFKIDGDKILPPLRGLQGVGENAAKYIVEAREMGEFLSIEDLKKKSKSTKTVIEALLTHGCLKGLPEDNQLSLFSMT